MTDRRRFFGCYADSESVQARRGLISASQRLMVSPDPTTEETNTNARQRDAGGRLELPERDDSGSAIFYRLLEARHDDGVKSQDVFRA